MKRFRQTILLVLSFVLFSHFQILKAEEQHILNDSNYYSVKEQSILNEDEQIIGMLNNSKQELVIIGSEKLPQALERPKLFFVRLNEKGEQIVRYDYPDGLTNGVEASLLELENNQYLLSVKRDFFEQLAEPFTDYAWIINEDGEIIKQLNGDDEVLNNPKIAKGEGQNFAIAAAQYDPTTKKTISIIRQFDLKGNQKWQITLDEKTARNQILAITASQNGYLAVGCDYDENNSKSHWIMRIDEQGNYQLFSLPHHFETAQLYFEPKSQLTYVVGSQRIGESVLLAFNQSNEIIWSKTSNSNTHWNQVIHVDEKALLISGGKTEQGSQRTSLDLFQFDLNGELIKQQNLTDYQLGFKMPFVTMTAQDQLLVLKTTLHTNAAKASEHWSLNNYQQLIPLIAYNAESQTVEVEDLVDVQTLFNLTALDPKDGDLTSKIEVDEQQLNVNRPGTYPITAKVTNSVGNTSLVELAIRVKQDFKFNIVQLMTFIGGALTIIAGIALYLSSRKRFKQSKK